MAAAIESSSRHPLAAAICAAADHLPAARDITEEAGFGMRGQVGEHLVRVGSIRWIEPGHLIGEARAMASAGMTVVVVEATARSLDWSGCATTCGLKQRRLLRLLSRAGIATLMLTGDNARTAHALAHAAGIDDVRAEQLPADKAAVIAELKMAGPVAMVGDGINDAPRWPPPLSVSLSRQAVLPRPSNPQISPLLVMTCA
ncbi:HAD family hydrolase [Ornithinimicrobium sp. INDO-MA30-4]|uniref:HAD family hydrolase n=1 Tax=Ornithinimicrobium sp. INDO-MA30-4 TaxID=2908651 RepID=UPI001F2F3272|nr:HAD family hydrolase [Ornithinimicrobium sp. INDO-MA30-4]UJH70684.1 HAD family hydrolase [Ornithinimicrobium sp. INDO-MA30-4]